MPLWSWWTRSLSCWNNAGWKMSQITSNSWHKLIQNMRSVHPRALQLDPCMSVILKETSTLCVHTSNTWDSRVERLEEWDWRESVPVGWMVSKYRRSIPGQWSWVCELCTPIPVKQLSSGRRRWTRREEERDDIPREMLREGVGWRTPCLDWCCRPGLI